MQSACCIMWVNAVMPLLLRSKERRSIPKLKPEAATRNGPATAPRHNRVKTPSDHQKHNHCSTRMHVRPFPKKAEAYSNQPTVR